MCIIIITPPSRHQDLMQSLSHMNNTTGVFDKHNVVVQRMINMTRHIIIRIHNATFNLLALTK